MKVRIKSMEEIRKVGTDAFPGFITYYEFNNSRHSTKRKHSMEYYCGKVIELDRTGHFDGWLWGDWMYNKIETPLLEVEE